MKTIVVLQNKRIIHKIESKSEKKLRLNQYRIAYNSQIKNWKEAEAKKLNVHELELVTRYLKQKRKAKRKSNKFYASESWKAKRKRVLKRDGFTCQECGSHKHLQVHHIKYRQFSNKEKDCVTLCVYCHAKKHPKNGSELLKGIL